MFNKIFLILYALFLFAITAFASNWIDIGNNMYIDVMSIANYKQNNIYSVWVKCNGNTEMEKISGEKIEFCLIMFLINCYTKESTIKSFAAYDNKGKSVGSYTYKDYELDWTPIYPNSTSEILYYLTSLASKNRKATNGRNIK